MDPIPSWRKSLIAEVVDVTIASTTNVEDNFQNKDVLYTQQLIAKVKNGSEKVNKATGYKLELTM